MFSVRNNALTRLAALLTTAFLALAATFTSQSSAFAEDLENTSDEVVEAIETQPWPEYGLGDQGPDIAAAKYLLVEHGFDPHLDEDAPSEFDGHTEAAVLSYQGANALHEDGRLNSETWELLRQQTFGEYGPGNSGPVVKAVQFLLNAKFQAHIPVDGEYGEVTEGVVYDAQEHFEIRADGIVGELTWRALVTYQDHDR